MTKLMDKAFEAISKLPPDRQDQLAEMLIDLAEADTYRLSDAERKAVEDGRSDIRAGQMVSEDEMAITFSRLRSA